MSVPVSLTETEARDLRVDMRHRYLHCVLRPCSQVFTLLTLLSALSPLSYIAWSVSPPCFQGGNQRDTFFQALQVKLIPVQGNSILPSEFISSKKNTANRCFPLAPSPFLVSRISLMHLIYFGFTVCIWARGLFTLSCKYIFTFPASYSKPQVKIAFIT